MLSGCAATTSPARSEASEPALHWLSGAPFDETERALLPLVAKGRASATDLSLLGSLAAMHGEPSKALDFFVQSIQKGVSVGSEQSLIAAEASVVQMYALEGRAGAFGQAATRLGEKIAGVSTTPRLSFLVHRMGVDEALRTDNQTLEREAIEAAGCLTRWRGAGAFGPQALLSFDDRHVPSMPGPLPAVVELGPGRGPSEAFDARGRGCLMELDAPGPSWGGTTYGVTYVDMEASQAVVLRVETLASVRVYVNDVEILSRDQRREYLPGVHWLEMTMPAGRSKIVIAITGRFGDPAFVASLSDRQGLPVITAQSATSTEGYSPIPPRDVTALYSAQPPGTAVDRYFQARIRRSESDTEGARSLLEEDGPLSASTAGKALLSETWAFERAVPFSVARNRTLALLEEVLEAEPQTWRPYYELARHHAEEERYAEALRLVNDGVTQCPNHPALWLLRASLLSTRGLWSEVQADLDEASRLVPDSCEPISARWVIARGRRRPQEELQAARELAACNRRSDALALTYLRGGQFSQAETELRRLLEVDGRQPMLLVSLADALRGQGDRSETDVLRQILDQNPEDRGALLDLVDLSESAEERDSLLAHVLAHVPAELVAERRLQALLSGSELLQDLRADGQAAIRAYEQADTDYDSPSVLVLDRTVFRVYDDGSVAELTHSVTRVLSAEGIELEGEFRVPTGAMLLAIRTIKENGEVLEPEDIQGKDTLSFPHLEVGDYVEVEYIRGHMPPPEFPGGVWPWRFYFQDDTRVFHHSELSVVAPSDFDFDLSFRGAPLPTEQQEVGGLRMLRWVARAMQPLTREPDAPHADEWVPSLHVSEGATWALFRDALREAVSDRDRLSLGLRQTVSQILTEAGASTDEERLHALYRWVAQHIQTGGSPTASVAHVLASRTGASTRLLAAMVEAAGIETKVGFARSSRADQTDDTIPGFTTYTDPVFHALGRWVFVGSEGRFAPSCYMPPDLRGQPVLMLEGDELFARIDESSCVPDASTVAGTFTMNAQGLAAATVTETITGDPAVYWRRIFDGTPREDWAGTLEEGYLADVLEGAQLRSLDVRAVETPDEPLVLVYELDNVRLGDRHGAEIRILLPYEADLGSFARLPSRTTPLVVHRPVAQVVELTIVMPQGSQATVPQPYEGSAPLGEYTASYNREGTELVARRAVGIRTGRVSPSDYGRFAAFCQEVDRLEQTHLVVVTAP